MLQFLCTLQALLSERLPDGTGRDDRGATAVEYGLMVALIAAVIIGGVALIGTNLDTMFKGVAAKL